MKRYLAAALAALFLLTGCFADDERPVVTPDDTTSSESASSSQGLAGSSVDASGEGNSQQSAFKFVVPEGYTLARIGMELEELGICTVDEFIEAAQTGDYSGYPLIAQQQPDPNRCFTLEGYLFPATYDFYANSTVEDIIRTMLNTTEGRLDAALRDEIAQSGFTVDQIITLASIVEKESFGIDEMPNVASVLRNRLAIGQQLQCDVTIKYVEGAIKPFITGDVDRYNDYYNTYTCPALPAGPICNPGLAAIKAALRPNNTEYYYFVTDKNNKFYYAVTFEEHQANIDAIKAAGLWA